MPNDDLGHKLEKLFESYAWHKNRGLRAPPFIYADRVLQAFADAGGLLPIRCRCGRMHSVAWQPHPGGCTTKPRPIPCSSCDGNGDFDLGLHGWTACQDCGGAGVAPSESPQDEPAGPDDQSTARTT
jgi:hypothetical protein